LIGVQIKKIQPFKNPKNEIFGQKCYLANRHTAKGMFIPKNLKLGEISTKKAH